MDRYLVESPHTAAECSQAVLLVEAAGYLTHFDWGCKDGVHCGWVIIEAESVEEARMIVPSLGRRSARVIRLNKFTPEEIRAVHHS